MKFKIKEKALSPQTKPNGKPRLNKAGEPLQSIQLIQSYEQRMDMLKRIKKLSTIYRTVPDLAPSGKHHIANDPKAYTVEEMMDDAENRFTNWTMQKNHIYKSFIERHNWILDEMIIGAYKANNAVDIIEMLDDECRIELELPKSERLAKALLESKLFELK